jgi:hypothetical protein
MMGHAAMEEEKTHTSLYTMGSPIAVWSLRFPDFGVPIQFPSDNLLPKYGGTPKEWVNVYDEDDIIAYPLKCLNAAYEANVAEDIEVNVGNILTMWNPASHTGYWTDAAVIRRIAEGLTRTWRAVNNL